MSAADKLRALTGENLDVSIPTLAIAFSALIEVVEGYERAGIVGCAGIGCSCDRCTALASLVRALGGED